VAALSLAGLVLILVTATALAVTGDLTQPAGTAGCISEFGGTCIDGSALSGAAGVAVSPDGKSVYVASHTPSSAVVRLNRNTTTGAIAQPAGSAGCVSEKESANPCAQGHALLNAGQVAVSPDGRSVYAVSSSSNALVRLNRNTTTGAVTQPAGTAGCVSVDGSGPCADGHGLYRPYGVAVSPDGKSVYVASLLDSVNGAAGVVARFNRNTTTGAITQPAGRAGCVSETGAGPCADGHALNGPEQVSVSPDGKSVYVTSVFSNAVARFNRNTTTGAISQPAGSAGCISDTGSGPCADGHAISVPSGVAVSPNGKSVYVASNSSKAVVRLNRNTTTGAIAEPAGSAGCISDTGAGPCADGHAIDPQRLAVSPDGKNVYVTSPNSWALVRLNRNTTTGAIAQPAGSAGCISEPADGTPRLPRERLQDANGFCAEGHALEEPVEVAVSPNGKSVYVTSYQAVARLNRAP
jgi:DNA-binding beta-propeller fold protein YncE